MLDRSRNSPKLRWAAIALTYMIAILVLCNLLDNAWILGFESRSLLWRAVESGANLGSVWMFAATPAFFFYLIYRFLANHAIMAKPSASASVDPASVGRRELLHTAGAIAVASPFVAMTYGVFVGRLDFHVREIDLPVRNLHPDLEGLRVLHLSDIHLGENLSEKDLARVIDASNQLRPNLAIMTGDLISVPDDPMDVCIRQLARIKSDAGMYGCLGNHEMYSGLEQIAKDSAAKKGINFLRMENRQLRFGKALLNIGGVDYQRSSDKIYLTNADPLIVDGATNMLLSHNPDVFPTAARQGWDATLSGHTHGGQVTLEIVEQTINVARFYTPYVAGAYHLGGAACYVTRGIGTVGIPARVGVPPEITLLRLRKA